MGSVKNEEVMEGAATCKIKYTIKKVEMPKLCLASKVNYAFYRLDVAEIIIAFKQVSPFFFIK